MDNDDLLRHLTHLTNTVTELLLWVQEAESKEVMPPGTLRAARIKTIRETLERIDQSDDLDDLRVGLRESLARLEGRVTAQRRTHGKA